MASSKSSADLEGRLETISLCEVVQFLDASHHVGVLHVQGPARQEGECLVLERGLAGARAGRLVDREALLAMLTWRTGRFAFSSSDDRSLASPVFVDAAISVPALVMESARLEDELERHADGSVSADRRLIVRKATRPPADPLECGANTVFAAIASKPGIKLTDLENAVPLAPIKIRLSIAWLSMNDHLTGHSAMPRTVSQQPAVFDWYAMLLDRYPAGIRVLIASPPEAPSEDVTAAIYRLAAELGAAPVGGSVAADGPSMVRIRPPQGGLVSLTFLPVQKKHKFLFQTFARTAELVLVTDRGRAADVAEWETAAPHHVPRATVHHDGSPDYLVQALKTFAQTLSEKRARTL
jgi:hypothetical protein